MSIDHYMAGTVLYIGEIMINNTIKASNGEDRQVIGTKCDDYSKRMRLQRYTRVCDKEYWLD